MDEPEVTVKVNGEEIEGWDVVTGKMEPMVSLPEAQYNSLIATIDQAQEQVRALRKVLGEVDVMAFLMNYKNILELTGPALANTTPAPQQGEEG